MADPFISRTDLGNYLGQTLTSSDKALIAIDYACDVCRTVSEQTFNQVLNEIIKLDGTGTDALLLPELPVAAVDSVVEDGETLVVTDDYKLNGNGILLRMPSVSDNGWGDSWIRRTWRCGRQNITVQYDHGYASADLPRDVRGVALSIAARFFNQAGGAVYETLGQYSVRYDSPASDLTNNELRILRKYRRSK